MSNPQLPPSSAEGPDHALTDSADLQAYFTQLRAHFATEVDAPIGATLAEFVDVLELTPLPAVDGAATPASISRRPKLAAGIGTFVATTAGKFLLGTTIAAASVGGMHAADIVDVPLLPEPARVDVVLVDAIENEGAVVQAPSAPETTIAPSATTPIGDSATPPSVARETEPEAADEKAAGPSDQADVDQNEVELSSDGPDTSLPAIEDDQPRNHGEQVSELARTTELEGCEKGQAISDLASSKSKKNDDDREDEDEDKPDKCDDGDEDESDDTDDGDDDESVDKSPKEKPDKDTPANDNKSKDKAANGTKSDDDDSSEDESTEDEDDDDEDRERPPAGNGHNRDDHPGQGKKADRDK